MRSLVGVVDFIDVGVGDTRWPTFNVADMAVSIGAFLLAWVLWQEDQSDAGRGARRVAGGRSRVGVRRRAGRARLTAPPPPDREQRPAVLGNGRHGDRDRPDHQAARRAVPRAALRPAPDHRRLRAVHARLQSGRGVQHVARSVLAVHLRHVRGHRAHRALAPLPAVGSGAARGRSSANPRPRTGVGRRGGQPGRPHPVAARRRRLHRHRARRRGGSGRSTSPTPPSRVGAIVLAWSLSREEREERHAREATANARGGTTHAAASDAPPAVAERDATRGAPGPEA